MKLVSTKAIECVPCDLVFLTTSTGGACVPLHYSLFADSKREIRLWVSKLCMKYVIVFRLDESRVTYFVLSTFSLKKTENMTIGRIILTWLSVVAVSLTLCQGAQKFGKFNSQ